MSPVSRGRKGKKQQRGPATGRSRGDRSNAGLDGFEGLYAEMLRAFRPLVKVIDPLEVEVFASDLVGAWWRQLPPGEDAEMVFGLGAIDHAARAGTREALALLRALAAVGVTAEQREAASTAAATPARVGGAGGLQPSRRLGQGPVRHRGTGPHAAGAAQGHAVGAADETRAGRPGRSAGAAGGRPRGDRCHLAAGGEPGAAAVPGAGAGPLPGHARACPVRRA